MLSSRESRARGCNEPEKLVERQLACEVIAGFHTSYHTVPADSGRTHRGGRAGSHSGDHRLQEVVFEGGFRLTRAVGALWSAGRRLAVGAAAELLVVTGRPVLSCGCGGARHRGTWRRYTGVHNNSQSFGKFQTSSHLISQTQSRAI